MEQVQTSIAVVVPTLNAAEHWPSFHKALSAQRVQPRQVLIVDSSSADGTIAVAERAGYSVLSVRRADFNHGATRHLAADVLDEAEILVFLTQDAILADPDALSELVKCMSDPAIGAAYGRQLPRTGATPIEAHARLFNYPPVSDVRTLSSRKVLGFKAIFISNSFAAYRREALMSVGGFPSDVLFGEDTITAAKLLLSNWKVAYVAEAQVYHSHGYTWRQDFKRYFDIGVLHSREAWLLREFGQTGSEGRKFVTSELRYLSEKCFWFIPSALVRTALKLFGYRLGRRESNLGTAIKRRLSMHPSYWS
jgi:rhamnosyltransferase